MALNRNLEEMLNNATPGTSYAQLGTLLEELIDKHNELLAKLDADAGITDTDYEATLGIVGLASR